jgi:hypothetical protein
MKTKKRNATVFDKSVETDAAATQTAEATPPGETTLDATPATASATPPPTATDAPPKRGRKAKAEGTQPAPSSGLTMRGLADGFIASLQAKGAGIGTVFSYHLDMNLALRHFGEHTLVSSLSPKKVENFNTSDVVCKTKTGRAKAPTGILKTQRVLRQALQWAAASGHIDVAPIPESGKPRRSNKDKAA